jgi:hypothetical protein
VTVRVAAADSFPYACVEYVCVCGATAHEHGTAARSLPPGWVRIEAPGEPGRTEHRCPHCAAAAEAPSRTGEPA